MTMTATRPGAKTAATRNLPPGLNATTIAHGFDVTTWTFLYTPVFVLSYDQQDPDQGIGVVTLRHGGADVTYDVPDGMTVLASYEAGGTETMIFHGRHSIDEDKFSTSVEASLSTTGVSGSASFALATTSKIDTNDTQSTTAISYYKQIYTYHRDAVQPLSAAFASEIGALPSSYSPAQDGVFQAFFKKWGTHVLASGTFGGNWVMNTFIAESVMDKLDTQDVKSSVSASFNEGVASGSTKTTIEDNTSKSLNLDDKTSSIRWHCLGGDSDKELNDWLNSVDTSIELLNDTLSLTTDAVRPVFTPIWTLASANQAAVKSAWEAYLPGETDLDDTLPAPISLQPNEIMQAATDGFLSIAMSTGGYGVNAGEANACTDGNPDPTTVMATASMHLGKEDHFYNASLFTPVRAKDWYKAAYSVILPMSPPAIQFQPIDLGLGAWEALTIDFVYPGRDVDGFVVGVISYVWDGFRGSVVGMQEIGGKMTAFAASSVHRVEDADTAITTESFCMPLARGTRFAVNTQPTVGLPSVSAHFIPMGPSRKLLPPQAYGANEIDQARSHGILTGTVEVALPGEQSPLDPKSIDVEGALSLQVAATADFANPTTIAQATAQIAQVFYDAIVPCNSASAFVHKGNWFRAGLARNDSEGSANATVYWTGIVPV
jgi:hypothetical protein